MEHPPRFLSFSLSLHTYTLTHTLTQPHTILFINISIFSLWVVLPIAWYWSCSSPSFVQPQLDNKSRWWTQTHTHTHSYTHWGKKIIKWNCTEWALFRLVDSNGADAFRLIIALFFFPHLLFISDKREGIDGYNRPSVPVCRSVDVCKSSRQLRALTWRFQMAGRRCPREPIQSFENPSEPLRTPQNPSEPLKIPQNPSESLRIPQNPSESLRIPQNPSWMIVFKSWATLKNVLHWISAAIHHRHSKNLRDFLLLGSISEHLGASRSIQEHPGASRSISEYPGVFQSISEHLRASQSIICSINSWNSWRGLAPIKQHKTNLWAERLDQIPNQST